MPLIEIMTADVSQPQKTLVDEPPVASDPRPIRVMYLVSTLHYGGAERQTVELAGRLDPARFSPILCSLDERVALAQEGPDRGGKEIRDGAL